MPVPLLTLNHSSLRPKALLQLAREIGTTLYPSYSHPQLNSHRFVLANTEVLHDKIGQLSNRVRQLEDALAESHNLNSPHGHPLLTEDLLQIKRPLERERLDEPAQRVEHVDNADAINALGSLYDANSLPLCP